MVIDYKELNNGKNFKESDIKNIFLKKDNKYFKIYRTKDNEINCDNCSLFNEFGPSCQAYCYKLNDKINNIKFKESTAYEALFSANITHA